MNDLEEINYVLDDPELDSGETRLLRSKTIEGDIARCREYILRMPSNNHSPEFKIKLKALFALAAVEKKIKVKISEGVVFE
jgi:hypothetical protein